MTVTTGEPNEPNATSEQNKPSGLGGWLILPAIGLVATPVRLLGTLVSDYFPIFQDGSWESVTTPGSPAYHYLWGPLIIFEIVGNLFFGIFAIVLFVLFLMKSHRFPVLMIALLVVNPLFVILDNFIGNLIPYLANIDDPQVYTEIVRGVVGAMIWVPYFLVSKRVRNTFVKPGVDKNMVEAFD